MPVAKHISPKGNQSRKPASNTRQSDPWGNGCFSFCGQAFDAIVTQTTLSAAKIIGPGMNWKNVQAGRKNIPHFFGGFKEGISITICIHILFKIIALWPDYCSMGK
ncbi:MAG: hypothetical protein ACP5IL_13910 [Syntrophobacteraceae bacterium]